jgi:hypothetical protein
VVQARLALGDGLRVALRPRLILDERLVLRPGSERLVVRFAAFGEVREHEQHFGFQGVIDPHVTKRGVVREPRLFQVSLGELRLTHTVVAGRVLGLLRQRFTVHAERAVDVAGDEQPVALFDQLPKRADAGDTLRVAPYAGVFFRTLREARGAREQRRKQHRHRPSLHAVHANIGDRNRNSPPGSPPVAHPQDCGLPVDW